MGTVNNITIDISDADVRDVIQQYFEGFNVYNNKVGIISFVLLYIILIITSLFGNILVVYILWKHPSMRSSGNFFLVNLAVADLMVTFVAMPTAAAKIVSTQWYLGNSMCRITHYVQGVAVSLSIYTITAMSIDRWQGINNPIQHRIFCTFKKTVCWIISLWFLALIQNMPIAVLQTTHTFKIYSDSSTDFLDEYVICFEDLANLKIRRIYDVTWFIISYGLPFIIITAAYFSSGWYLYTSNHERDSDATARNLGRRSAAKSLFLMPLICMVCWIPYNSLNLLQDFQQPDNGSNDESLKKLYPISVFWGHLNSVINPLLYCLLTKNFQEKISLIFSSCSPTFICFGHGCSNCSAVHDTQPENSTLEIEEEANANGNVFSISYHTAA